MTQIIILIVALVVVGLLILVRVAQNRLKNTPLIPDHQKIITLTETNINHQLKNKIVLVDFWASWCAPCRVMAPVLNEVAEELKGGRAIGKVDIEQFQSLAAKYKVRSIPTLVLFKNGQEVTRFVGIKNKEFLLAEIAKIQ